MRFRLQASIRVSVHPLLVCLLALSAFPLGAVKLQILEGRPIVDGVYVNGSGPYRFLIDTGSNVNLIETGLARKIGMIPTFHVELASTAGNATAKILTPGTDGNQIELGAVKAGGQKFLISSLEAIHHLSPGIQGVLGQWFFSGFDYILDLRAKRLEFGKQERAGTRSPFTMINARPVVATSLGDLALDSGSASLVLFGIQPDPDSDPRTELRTLSGSQRVGMVSGRPLIIEGRKVWGGSAVAMPLRNEPGVDGLMPLSLFKSIYVCNSERYVLFN